MIAHLRTLLAALLLTAMPTWATEITSRVVGLATLRRASASFPAPDWFTGLALMLLCCLSPSALASLHDEGPTSPTTGQGAPWAPPDLPLDAEGVPTRPLTDDELFRLLLALSTRNQPATALLARCHAQGTPTATRAGAPASWTRGATDAILA